MRITQQTDGSWLVYGPDADGIEHILGKVTGDVPGHYLAHPVLPADPGDAIGFAGAASFFDTVLIAAHSLAQK